MKLILDEREIALREKCLTDNTVEGRMLPLGDALIMDDSDNIVLLIERKTLSDLLASIKDGRYEEQSHRLIHSSGIPPHHIVYIIEGMMSQLHNPAERKMVYSAMTTLQVFKGFSVLRTCSVQETADWILNSMDKIGRDTARGKKPWSPDTHGNTDIAPPPYCSVVKKVKKDNITPENIGEIVLCQIPGISAVSAVTIMREFRSLSNLMRQLKQNPECLGELVCESKGKTRKLSKLVAQNVAAYLLYECEI
jgi:ERCC4-type nuclease